MIQLFSKHVCSLAHIEQGVKIWSLSLRTYKALDSSFWFPCRPWPGGQIHGLGEGNVGSVVSCDLDR